MASQFSGSFGDIPKQIDSIIDDMMGRSFTRFCPVSAWQPAVNLYETDDAYIVCVDLAGMKKADFNLSAERNSLVIRGKRPRPKPENTADSRIHLMEINSGEFCRDVAIPTVVQQEKIEATYRDGLLWIRLPKVEAR